MKTTDLQIKKTKAGADYKVFTMEDGNKLSVFQFDSRYAEIEVGTDLPAEVLVFDPAYSNFKLKPLARAVGANRGQSGANIAKVMETKNENITKHAENKDKSITLAAAQRDAVLMVTTFEKNTPFPTDDQLKEKIKEWREWFLAQHDIVLNRPF